MFGLIVFIVGASWWLSEWFDEQKMWRKNKINAQRIHSDVYLGRGSQLRYTANDKPCDIIAEGRRNRRNMYRQQYERWSKFCSENNLYTPTYEEWCQQKFPGMWKEMMRNGEL